MSQKKFAYGRVSSSDQNEDRQVLEFLEYGINERDIFIDKQSGRTFNRTNYLVLRDNILREGDVLVVKSIDRFGRNYSAIRTEWEHITKTIGADIVEIGTWFAGIGQSGAHIIESICNIIALVFRNVCLQSGCHIAIHGFKLPCGSLALLTVTIPQDHSLTGRTRTHSSTVSAGILGVSIQLPHLGGRNIAVGISSIVGGGDGYRFGLSGVRSSL